MPLPSFTPKTDLIDTIFAADVNELQNEVAPTAAGSAHVRYSTSYTSTDNVTLTDASMPVQSINFSSNSAITLPAISTANHPFYLINRSTSSVATIIFSGSTLNAIPAGGVGVAYSDSTASWKVHANTAFSLAALVAALTEDTNPDLVADFVPTYDTSAGTMKKDRPVYLSGYAGGEGILQNGKISVTVSASDLVVAIKTFAGTDPSTSDPVLVRINGTVRKITVATSITLADGTNWFSLGSAPFAALEHNLFAYAVWDSNSSVVAVSCARVPFGRLVSDFNSTNTNELYLGNYANFTSTDDVVNIGRFSATLSAAAGHVWTVPTFTSDNLIQNPIFETEWTTWAPAPTGYSAVPTNTVYQYKVLYKDAIVRFREATNGTSNATTMTMTAPFTAQTLTNMVWAAAQGTGVDNSVQLTTPVLANIASGSATISFFTTAGLAAWTNANGKRVGTLELRYAISG